MQVFVNFPIHVVLERYLAGVVVGSWAGGLPDRKPFTNGFTGGPLNQHRYQYNQQQQQQSQHHHQQQLRPNYTPYGCDNAGTYHQLQHHNQPSPPHHQQRMRGLNASLFYNNLTNRKRRGQGPFMNGGNGAGGAAGGGIVHRTIGRKSSGPLGACIAGGSGAGVELKLAKNKARRNRAKNSKAVTTKSNTSADVPDTVPTVLSTATTTTSATTEPKATTDAADVETGTAGTEPKATTAL